MLLLSALLVACSPAPTVDLSGAQVTVELRDFSVSTNVPSVAAGKVKIGIRNAANMAHDLVVLKTDTAFDKLPIDGGSAKAKEEGKVGGVDLIGAGRVVAVTLELVPGNYILLCNVAGHYQLGMRAAFKVG